MEPHLPMGISSGCAIFEAFSSAVQFLAEKRGCGPMNLQGAERKLKLFKMLCEVLAYP